MKARQTARARLVAGAATLALGVTGASVAMAAQGPGHAEDSPQAHAPLQRAAMVRLADDRPVPRAERRHGADDLAGDGRLEHSRHGADDPAGDDRGMASSDDSAGHIRHSGDDPIGDDHGGHNRDRGGDDHGSDG